MDEKKFQSLMNQVEAMRRLLEHNAGHHLEIPRAHPTRFDLDQDLVRP